MVTTIAVKFCHVTWCLSSCDDFWFQVWSWFQMSVDDIEIAEALEGELILDKAKPNYKDPNILNHKKKFEEWLGNKFKENCKTSYI